MTAHPKTKLPRPLHGDTPGSCADCSGHAEYEARRRLPDPPVGFIQLLLLCASCADTRARDDKRAYRIRPLPATRLRIEREEQERREAAAKALKKAQLSWDMP